MDDVRDLMTDAERIALDEVEAMIDAANLVRVQAAAVIDAAHKTRRKLTDAVYARQPKG